MRAEAAQCPIRAEAAHCPIRAEAAQWRISTDRALAADIALRAGADLIALDFGGAHRGARLDDARELAVVDRLPDGLAVETLAVNHANDLGLFTTTAAINDDCLRVVLAAAEIVTGRGWRYLHVPSFRASAIVGQAEFATTAAFLGRCACHVGPDVTVLTESTLGATDAIALRDAAGEPNVRIVADTGNLVDAGVDPAAFVTECRAADALAPVIHVKAPARAAGRTLAASIRDVGWGADSILLENDYRRAPQALAADVAVLRHEATAPSRPRSGDEP